MDALLVHGLRMNRILQTFHIIERKGYTRDSMRFIENDLRTEMEYIQHRNRIYTITDGIRNGMYTNAYWPIILSYVYRHRSATSSTGVRVSLLHACANMRRMDSKNFGRERERDR